MGTLPIYTRRAQTRKSNISRKQNKKMASKHLQFIILGLFIVMALGASASTTPNNMAQTVPTTMAPPKITTAPGKVVTVAANAPWYDQPTDIALVIIAFNFAMIVGVGPFWFCLIGRGRRIGGKKKRFKN